MIKISKEKDDPSSLKNIKPKTAFIWISKAECPQFTFAMVRLNKYIAVMHSQMDYI